MKLEDKYDVVASTIDRIQRDSTVNLKALARRMTKDLRRFVAKKRLFRTVATFQPTR
jgi:hypothetical protein